MGDDIGQNSEPQAGLSPPPRAASFPVIGLGASAGGLQALKDFFTHMPAESGMAFVVIMHLSPRHESYAASLLQATTGMSVTQATAFPLQQRPDEFPRVGVIVNDKDS